MDQDNRPYQIERQEAIDGDPRNGYRWAIVGRASNQPQAFDIANQARAIGGRVRVILRATGQIIQ